jgi:hypothetical protein
VQHGLPLLGVRELGRRELAQRPSREQRAAGGNHEGPRHEDRLRREAAEAVSDHVQRRILRLTSVPGRRLLKVEDVSQRVDRRLEQSDVGRGLHLRRTRLVLLPRGDRVLGSHVQPQPRLQHRLGEDLGIQAAGVRILILGEQIGAGREAVRPLSRDGAEKPLRLDHVPQELPEQVRAVP